MANITYPNTFSAGTTIIASQMNANFSAVTDQVNGSLDQTNFGSMTGAITWAITSNVLAQSISSNSTEGLVSMDSTGVLASAKSGLKVSSSAAQTTGDGLIYAEFSSASSSIPLAKLSNAGTGSSLEISDTGTAAAGKAALEVSSTTKGVLLPRMTTVNRDAISSPGESLLIFNTTTNQFEYRDDDNSSWKGLEQAENTSGFSAMNWLRNGGFEIWIRGTSGIITNGGQGYQADGWYVDNGLGTNGVITFSRVAGVSDGAKYGASVEITTAPTASQANGCELYQTLENFDSLEFYNKNGSFQVKVKALGNVNSVGIQFFYKTTEAKVDTAIGSEVTATVNSSTFTTIEIDGQAMGTSMTTSGSVGVRIRIEGVSSGNTYDINNGFVVEQAMMTQSDTAQDYRRRNRTFTEELEFVQRFYEKSYAHDVALGTATFADAESIIIGGIASAAHAVRYGFKYSVEKRAVPTVGYYTVTTGAAGSVDVAGTTAVPTVIATGERGAVIEATGTSTSSAQISFHWVADAEI